MVDKPLALTAAEGRRLVAAARERGVLLTVFHNRRWDGDLAGARVQLERALAVGEAALGPDHPTMAIRRNNLGSLLQALWGPARCSGAV